MLLHPGVERHALIDLHELSLLDALDRPNDAQRRVGPELLRQTFEIKMERSRARALVLLPLYSGLQLSWKGQDLYSTALPGAIASLLDPNAGEIETQSGYHAVTDASGMQVSTMTHSMASTHVPPGTILRLVAPLGVPVSSVTTPADDILESYVVNHSQVWQVEMIHNGVVHNQKLALKLYDDRLRNAHYRVTWFVPTVDPQVLPCNGITMASNEAAAYKKLANIQGSLIPRSYGTYEVSSQILLLHRYIRLSTCPLCCSLICAVRAT